MGHHYDSVKISLQLLSNLFKLCVGVFSVFFAEDRVVKYHHWVVYSSYCVAENDYRVLIKFHLLAKCSKLNPVESCGMYDSNASSRKLWYSWKKKLSTYVIPDYKSFRINSPPALGRLRSIYVGGRGDD